MGVVAYNERVLSALGLTSASVLRSLVLSLLAAATGATYKGFINPLKHYDPVDGKVFWLNISNSEPADELARAIEDFFDHREEYRDNVAVLSKRRIGHERCDPFLVDTQNIWPTVQRLQHAGFTLEGRYVNVGASDGQSDDPLYEYVRRTNATGVAVERDPVRCARHRQSMPQVEVACEEVTPQNILSLVASAQRPGGMLDILKVDIDSYDCPVIEVLLSALTARIVLIEVNPSIPPPYQWAMLHHPDFWSFFSGFSSPEKVPIRGCSLAYEVDLLHRLGYDFIMFGGHDAVFTHHTVRAAWQPLQPPVDEFDCYNEAFIVANGVPIERTRRWFFQLNDPQVALPEIWEFFASWMQEQSPRLFPFILRG